MFAGAEGPADEAASSGRTQSAEEPASASASASASAPPLPELSADELSQILADREAALEEQQHLVRPGCLFLPSVLEQGCPLGDLECGSSMLLCTGERGQ